MFKRLMAFTAMLALTLAMSGCAPSASLTNQEHTGPYGEKLQSMIFTASMNGDYYADMTLVREDGAVYAHLQGSGRTVPGQIADFGKSLGLTVVDVVGGRIIAEATNGTEYEFDISPVNVNQGPTNVNRVDNRVAVRSNRDFPAITLTVPIELQGRISALLEERGYLRRDRGRS